MFLSTSALFISSQSPSVARVGGGGGDDNKDDDGSTRVLSVLQHIQFVALCVCELFVSLICLYILLRVYNVVVQFVYSFFSPFLPFETSRPLSLPRRSRQPIVCECVVERRERSAFSSFFVRNF